MPAKTSRRLIEVDGKKYTIYEAEAKYGISANLIWLRVTKLGWTPRQSVGLDAFSSKSLKSIVFRGKKYAKQEDLYGEFAPLSERSVTTMRIAMASLRKRGVELTDELIEEVLFGRWQPEDIGGYLYKLTCIPTGKIYVGITSRPIVERWAAHVAEAKAGVNSPLKKAIREFGKDQFSVENLGHFKTAKQLKQVEKDRIFEYNCIHPFGLNSNKGGTLGGIDRNPVTVSGKTYRSMSDLARTSGLAPRLLMSRIHQDGMSLENAVNLGPAKVGGRRLRSDDGKIFFKEPWVVQGEEFQTLEDVGKRFEVSPKTISVRMSAGWNLEEAVAGFKQISCLACNSLFLQKRKTHKFCSSSCKEAFRSQTVGGQKSGTGNNNASVIGGIHFKSDSEVARQFGVNRQRFRALLTRGLSPDSAISILQKAAKEK